MEQIAALRQALQTIWCMVAATASEVLALEVQPTKPDSLQTHPARASSDL